MKNARAGSGDRAEDIVDALIRLYQIHFPKSVAQMLRRYTGFCSDVNKFARCFDVTLRYEN